MSSSCRQAHSSGSLFTLPPSQHTPSKEDEANPCPVHTTLSPCKVSGDSTPYFACLVGKENTTARAEAQIVYSGHRGGVRPMTE